MKVYENEFNAGRIEYIAQNVDAFNQASAGCILLRSEELEGNYSKESFFQTTAGLVNRRDATSVAAGTVVSLAMEELIGVKLKRYSLAEQTQDAFKALKKSPSEFSFVVGQQFAKAELQEKLTQGLAAFIGATGNVGVTVATDATGSTIDHTKLARLLALFGDRAKDIKCWVMHSKVAFDLLSQSIADKITNIADQAIIGASIQTLGRPVVISDAAELINGSGKYYTLGLTEGAIDIVDSEQRGFLSETVGGLRNLVERVQTEYAFNLGLKGYKYLVASGVNPDSTAVALGTNWPKVAASIKDTAGVRLLTD